MILSSSPTVILDLRKHLEKHNATEQASLCHQQHGASLPLSMISELQQREVHTLKMLPFNLLYFSIFFFFILIFSLLKVYQALLIKT